MRRVIFNQKGGVGKSTITCNLAAIEATQGKRTLVIDLDAQANATRYLLGKHNGHNLPTLVDFFDQMLSLVNFGAKDIDHFIHETPFEGLFIMPSHRELETLQDKLMSRYKVYKLRDALNKLSDHFDAVYIDTPPAMNFYTRSALIASDRCLIPFDCDDFSRQALYTLLENVQEIREDHNDKLSVEGIIVNQFQARARLPQKLVKEMKEEGLPVLNTCISASVKIRESHEDMSPMIHMAPYHKVTQEFLALHKELNNS